MGKKIDLSYPTILKAVDVLRFAIIANSIDADTWMDFLYFHPATSTQPLNKGETVTAFGILENQGKAKIDILKDVSLSSISQCHPQMLRRSLVYFTDEYPPYSILLFHDQINGQRQPFGNATDPMDGPDSTSDFWLFAQKIIARHRGVAKEKFPLYLKEIEFRYNHKDGPIFDMLCRYLASFIPDG